MSHRENIDLVVTLARRGVLVMAFWLPPNRRADGQPLRCWPLIYPLGISLN